MRIFVAGASGAIGLPLGERLRRGCSCAGCEGRSSRGRHRRADVSAQEAVRDGRRRTGRSETEDEGGRNLHRAAMACGVRRYIQQASGFFLERGSGLADESADLAVNASPRVALNPRAYAELESRVLNAGEMEGVTLRYGFFYGPGIWYHPKGASADQVRGLEVPVIGDGGGRLVMGPDRRRSPLQTSSQRRPACTPSSITTRPPSPSGCRHSPGSSAPRLRHGLPRCRRGLGRRGRGLLRHKAPRRLEPEGEEDIRLEPRRLEWLGFVGSR